VFRGFVLSAVAAASTTIATFEEGETCTAAGHTAACATNYTPYYAEDCERSEYYEDNDWPFAIRRSHAIIPRTKSILHTR